MTSAPVYDRLSTLADETRTRVLHLIDGRELTVSELCAVLQLPQSTVSRHLKVLGDDGWVVARSEGTSRYYGMTPELADTAKRLWEVVKLEVGEGTVVRRDAHRLKSVLAARRSRTQEFFANAAAQWEATRSELFGRRLDLLWSLALLDHDATLGDLGCGGGHVAELASPWVRKVIGVDGSPEMLLAAHRRLDELSNVELRSGALESLPIAKGELDIAILSLVLPYVAEPESVIREAHRALAPTGRLVIVDMLSHDREEYRSSMGHLWLGFTAAQVSQWLRAAGFAEPRLHPLPADPAVAGPALFVATATAHSST